MGVLTTKGFLMTRLHTSVPRRARRLLVAFSVAVAGAFGLAQPATAAAPPLQTLRAPFACGTEWVGATRSGHGLNDWNLDINSTARTYADPQHDLGAPLLAQADGTIVWIGWHVSAGTYVEIDYGDITARYIHLVDDSVPDALGVGSEVSEGQFFGELGDSGNATHAHLHLEYFDSRAYDDARAYLLPATNQIQIAMDGELIDPGETFVSTNCDGDPLPRRCATRSTTWPRRRSPATTSPSSTSSASPPVRGPGPTPHRGRSPGSRWPPSWPECCASTAPPHLRGTAPPHRPRTLRRRRIVVVRLRRCRAHPRARHHHRHRRHPLLPRRSREPGADGGVPGPYAAAPRSGHDRSRWRDGRVPVHRRVAVVLRLRRHRAHRFARGHDRYGAGCLLPPSGRHPGADGGISRPGPPTRGR
ncbi:MAG: M23 family metallopeptidase [Acidimicrobiales bacterium]